jgi:hypothetical protein
MLIKGKEMKTMKECKTAKQVRRYMSRAYIAICDLRAEFHYTGAAISHNCNARDRLAANIRYYREKLPVA